MRELSYEDFEYHPVIDRKGQVYFFPGFLFENDDEKIIRPLSVRLSEKMGKKTLLRVVAGRLVKSKGIWTRQDQDAEIKVLRNHIVVLPDRGASRRYGVIKRDTWEQNDTLTQNIFGLTQDQLDDFLEKFALTLHNFNQWNRRPRTTASNRKNNNCDLTGRWIPEGFPYIAFTESNYYGGHVSLPGFYHFITLLCIGHNQNRSYQALIKRGIDKDLLDMIFELSLYYGEEEV